MEIEEAIDILENIIDDEVIGTYCVEIQKEGVNCSKNCEDKDCYLSEAIHTIGNYIDKLQKENEDMREELQMYVDTPINKLVVENEQLQADKNKLINYIAVRENKTHEEVCKEFEIGE